MLEPIPSTARCGGFGDPAGLDQPLVSASGQPRNEGPGEILPLTGVRFLAAGWVVLHHTLKSLLPGAYQQPVMRAVADSGWLGVDLFFVLSGYILAVVYLRGQNGVNRTTFYRARVARVYPLYAFSLGVSLPILWAWSFSAGFSAESLDWFLTKIGLHVFMLQAWPAFHAKFWNLPSWSLSVEVFFYYLFPAIGVRLWKSSRPLLLFLVISAIGIAVEILCAWALPASPAGIDLILHSLPPLRLPQFLLGILAARFSLSPRFGKIALLAGAGSIAVSVICSSITLQRSLGPAFALLVIGLASTNGWVVRTLSSDRIVSLGKASYAIYLLHWPLWCWFLAARTLELRQPSAGDGSSSPALYVLYWTVLIGFSALCYRYLEVPARRWIRKSA